MFSCCMSILARSTSVAVGELAGAHPPEQVEVLVDACESRYGDSTPGWP